MSQLPANIQPSNKRKIASLSASSNGSDSSQFAQIRLSSDDLQMANGTTVISADGVAYRLVQFPTESFQTHQIVNQQSQTHIINAEDLQQLMSNTTFVTSGQQIQIQNDQQQSTQQNQFYMVMGSGEIVSPGQSATLQPAAFIPITKLEMPQQTVSQSQSRQPSSSSATGKISWPTHQNQSVVVATTSSPQVVKEVKRRCSHNEVEKRRRDKINNWIMKLAKLVPLAETEEAKSTASKGAILSKTVDYLVALQSTEAVDRLAEMVKIQTEVEYLRAENSHLRKLLDEANIPAEFSSQQFAAADLMNKRAKVERNSCEVEEPPSGDETAEEEDNGGL